MPLLVAFLCLLAVGGPAWAQRPTPPVVFHASFDGTLEAQARGDGKPVKVEGPVAYRPGKVGQALLCGEGGALVHYATPGNLRAAAGSVELWVCPLDWTGEEDEFHVFLEALNPGWLVFYRYYQGGFFTLLGTDGGVYRAAGSDRIRWKPGEWHHLAGTWRTSRLEVYVDGQRAGFVEDPPVPDRLADTFRLGDHPWHVARKRQTLLDEVRLYSVPLDGESIARAAQGEAVQPAPRVVLQLAGDPDADTLRVTCDAAGLVGEAGPGRRARVELVPQGQAEPTARAEIATFPKDVGRCALPLANAPEGDYEVRAALLDAAGKEITRAVVPFTRPGPPVWSGNTLGLADKVLPPWTPLRVVGAGGMRAKQGRPVTLGCWGRRYEFGGLLRQVRSAGANLLARPVTLEAVIGGKTVTLSTAASRLEKATDTRATLSSTVAAAGLKVTARHQVEYDGYTWTNLTVDPARPLRVGELRLTWRMPRAQATLMHADAFQWINNPAGSLKPEGWSSDFTHFFWLGNEERGLSWYAESPRGWRPSATKRAIEVTPRGDEVLVTIRLIAEPTTLAAKRTYGFGMMATPVRPRPPDARRWRMPTTITADADSVPTDPNRNFTIVWPNNNMRWYGYPEPIDRAKFAAYVKAAHQKGCRVVPYINLNFISAGAPEWLFYGSRWADPSRVVTPSDVAAMGYASMGTCPASRDWQDFILYRINEMIDRYGVDGIYIDCWAPQPCKAGTCGWKDEKGEVQPTRPIRAYREILRRVYALCHEKRPDALLMVHMSSEVVIPMLSFTDTILDGEQFTSGNLKEDYLELLPPDKFRAEFLGRNWGPVAFFLPELREPHVAVGTPNLAAYLLLHDVNPWPIWSDGAVWTRLFSAVDAAGINDARFLPYWKGSGVRAPEEVLVSAYVGKSAVILAVMNTGEATEARLALDLPRLGLKGIASAIDLLRDEPARVEGSTLTIPLARRQGRVLVVKPGDA